jgi:hypothetical protein
MDVVLNLALRAVYLLMGAGAAIWIFHWVRTARTTAEERWPLRIAVGMLVLAGVYAVGHARLLSQRAEIEEGRTAYLRFGDPRLAELRRAEVRGWILDCGGRVDDALALYRARDGDVTRTYPLGQAGANLIGGGEEAVERDFTIERLFADELRRPRGLGELGEIHPAGTDLRLTLCGSLTREAWSLLRGTGHPGAVVVQNVRTGGLVAYAATGGPEQAPIGIHEYAPPGSVFKLALAALWWDNALPDTTLGCPSTIEVTPRATIRNSEVFSISRVSAPTEMLVYSCNTTAVQMAMIARARLGESAFIRAYEQFGFTPYVTEAPSAFQTGFWRTDSDAWRERMSPRPARLRMGRETGDAEWAQIAIGQGPVDATAIHVSRFLQAIGNDGVMLSPTIEWEMEEEVASRGARAGTRVMSTETARRLRTAMLEVVDRGTGRRARAVVDAIDWDLGGKTGTAQRARADDSGWFAGLIHDPEGAPRYTVVVYLRGGGAGGGRPAQIAAGMTRAAARYAGGTEPR